MKKIKLFTILITAFILIILIIKPNKIYNSILKNIYPIKYEEFVEQYSKEYNVDSLLIYSIIKAESNFDENAKSSSGAQGLMQLMTNTVLELTSENEELSIKSNEQILEPQNNIMLGTSYYSYLYGIYDNTELALAAYNAGPGNVNRWIENGTIKADGSDIENIPFKETNMYVRKIVNNYKIYKELYINN